MTRPKPSKKRLSAEFQGAHALFVNSDLNYLNYDSEALLLIFFPDVSRRSNAIDGAEALVSIDRARQTDRLRTVRPYAILILGVWPVRRADM